MNRSGRGRPAFRDLLEDGQVHIFDGAMGTLLYERGVFVNVCYDALVLERPDLVGRIHAEYAAAGAEILETNTFGANPVKLSAFGLEGKTREINREGAILAGRSAPRAVILGSVGPLGVRIEPWGPTGRDEAEEYFKVQVEGLLEGGVDGFVLETFADLHELQAAFRAVRSLSDLPVVAQMSLGSDLRTAYGMEPEALGKELDSLSAEVVGLNCSVGPAIILEALELLAPHTGRALSAQPNAGLPRPVGDRRIYMASPDYMAQYARRFVEAGVRFVGGCCGTTPEHIRRIAEVVGSVGQRVAVRVGEGDRGSRALADARRKDPARGGGAEPVPLERRSVFGAALARGEFLRTVELLPPRGWDVAEMVAAARIARDGGAHAVTLVDTPRGLTRMGSVAAGLVVQQQAGLEAVVHYSCRNRNMMGMISDLLGAAAAGIRNLLVVSGDPPASMPGPGFHPVLDIDSVGLTNVAVTLNRGLDPGGNPIGSPTRFVVGVAANPAAPDLEREVGRFRWKVEAGADFAITQPVFEVELLERFLERVARWPIPLLVALWPLRSLREAEFLANEVPGVVVPPWVLSRMAGADDRGPEAAREEGLRLAREVLEDIRPLVRGVHLHVPGGDVGWALGVFEE